MPDGNAGEPALSSAKDVFKAGQALYGQNFGLFMGIVAPPLVLRAVLDVIIQHAAPSLMGVMGVLDLLLVTVAVGAVVPAIAARWRHETITVAGAYSALGLGGAVVFFLATVLSFILIGLGLILLIIPGLYLAIRFAFVAQTARLEGEGITGSLRRSWALTDGNIGRVIGLSLFNLVFQIVVTGVLLPFILVFLHFTGSVGAFAASLLGILGVPFFEALMTLLYVDVLARRMDPQVSAGTATPAL